jgi:hypothetical protein
MALFTKHDKERFIKIGYFWYPKDFYEMYDDYLLQVPLQHFTEFVQIKEVYDFLLEVRHFKPSKTYRLFEQFIRVGAPQEINISNERRQEVLDFLDSTDGFTAGHIRRKGRPRQQRHNIWSTNKNPIFTGCRQDLLTGFKINYTAIIDDQKFWRSPMFLAMHNYRTKKMLRFWKTNRNIPVEQISQSAFDSLLASSTNHASPEQMAARFGITVEEYLEAASKF